MSRVLPNVSALFQALTKTDGCSTQHARNIAQLHIDWLHNRRVIVLRPVHSCRDRPHPHQVALLAEPARVVSRRQDRRHTVVDVGDQLVDRSIRLVRKSVPAVDDSPPGLGESGRDDSWSDRLRSGDEQLLVDGDGPRDACHGATRRILRMDRLRSSVGYDFDL
jgi:hypothetical protein